MSRSAAIAPILVLAGGLMVALTIAPASGQDRSTRTVPPTDSTRVPPPRATPAAPLGRVDSTRTPAPALVTSGRPDSASGAPDSISVDFLFAWTAWPDIEPAIALDDLDGPEDILEKEEIIEDRIDDLDAEGVRLDSLAAIYGDRRRALEAQMEVLEDLADLQLDGDLEFQQRLDAVRGDLRQARDLGARTRHARQGLEARLQALRALARDYRQRAADLRAREERR